MKNKNLGIILLLAMFLGLIWGANHHIQGSQYPDYTSFSSGRYGISLLHDTLQHMHYPVSLLYRPVQEAADVNDAVFIIQPTNPRPNEKMIEDILNWVQRGGRLIYLENRHPSTIAQMLGDEHYTTVGSLRLYQLGMGQVMTGRADVITNANLMENYFYGESIVYVLNHWNPERIFFAEYYHGFHRASSTFEQMPLWLRLVAIQIIIGTMVLVWHLGKRFGSPIPLYEEIEREENEQVLALARLYKQTKK